MIVLLIVIPCTHRLCSHTHTQIHTNTHVCVCVNIVYVYMELQWVIRLCSTIYDSPCLPPIHTYIHIYNTMYTMLAMLKWVYKYLKAANINVCLFTTLHIKSSISDLTDFNIYIHISTLFLSCCVYLYTSLHIHCALPYNI